MTMGEIICYTGRIVEAIDLVRVSAKYAVATVKIVIIFRSFTVGWIRGNRGVGRYRKWGGGEREL